MEWDNAEKSIKIAEQITGQVAIPCVMELRYAGRRIGEAARASDNQVRFRELMADAKFDCIRAQHDAVDIAVNYIARFVDEVILKTEPLALGGRYSKVKEYLAKIESYQSRIAESRLNREKRAEIYSDLQVDLGIVQTEFVLFKNDLIDIIEESDRFYEDRAASRLSILNEALRAERSKRTYTILLTVTGAIGLLLSVVANLFAW